MLAERRIYYPVNEKQIKLQSVECWGDRPEVPPQPPCGGRSSASAIRSHRRIYVAPVRRWRLSPRPGRASQSHVCGSAGRSKSHQIGVRTPYPLSRSHRSDSDGPRAQRHPDTPACGAAAARLHERHTCVQTSLNDLDSGYRQTSDPLSKPSNPASEQNSSTHTHIYSLTHTPSHRCSSHQS